MSHGAAVLDRRGAEDASDRQLLRRFVADGEEAAFAVLVRRHGPQVLRVCRRVLRDGHAAEDVVQATFLVLARKAGVVPWHESVGGWLVAVAYRLARHAAGRRREQPLPGLDGWDVPAGQPDPLDEAARHELRRVVADELHRLPEKYRAPAVLCYLEGKTNEEAARQLGWPAGSMSRRLARARALLREGLSRRGLALLLLVACGAFAGLRLTERSVAVAELMRPFKAKAEGGRDLELALRQLAAGSRPEAAEELARTTAAVAERLRNHEPTTEPHAWRRLSEALRASALDLSTALAAHDDPATLLAARRLTASCQHCHAVFRD